MGTTDPSHKRSLPEVEALAREKPTQLMAQLRSVWPQVRAALDAGHTLRLIHKRLNASGIPISYKCLSAYRGRIERGKKGRAGSASPKAPGKRLDTAPSQPFDPLANLRAHEQRKPEWQYPTGPPDESKIF